MDASPPITINLDEQDDRFARFRLIGWWDQARLSAARVLVIGAGALGNEIVKNLALLGIGNILVADMDRIESSNLSRSILFRAADNGKYKAIVAAEAAREIYPDMRSEAFVGNVVYDLGLGAFRWADVVIGGLDNREARLSINRNCGLLGKPWIDGAIEQIQGVARVFAPGGAGACYECTMSQTDWKLLANRRSCNLLSRSEMETGKTPTTPTISSIIAGVQCQEAVKLLHGMETLEGKGWVFTGATSDSYTIDYQRKDDCVSHDPLSDIVELRQTAGAMTAGQLLEAARQRLGPLATLDLGRDVLEKLVCPNCGAEEQIFSSLGKIKSDKSWCPRCPQTRRQVVTFHRIEGHEAFLDMTLADIGVPAFDIIAASAGAGAIGFELSDDAGLILGQVEASRGVNPHRPLADAPSVAHKDSSAELDWT